MNSVRLMSLSEIEQKVSALPPEELRAFRSWFYEHEAAALEGESSRLTPGQEEELRRRKQEYFEHPERFRRVNSEQELKEYFTEVRHAIHPRLPSAGRD